jgi:hypothetical protein
MAQRRRRHLAAQPYDALVNLLVNTARKGRASPRKRTRTAG